MAMSFLLLLTALSALAYLAGRLGADSRPHDPDRPDPQWPFARHDC
jgi:hypothetical protein